MTIRSVTGEGESARVEFTMKSTTPSVAERIMSIDRQLPQLRRDKFSERDGVFRFVTRGGLLSWGQTVIVSLERRDEALAESRATRDGVGVIPVAVEVEARQRLGLFQTQSNRRLADLVARTLRDADFSNMRI